MLMFKKRRARQEQSQTTASTPATERRVDEAHAHEDEIRSLAYLKWDEAGRPACDGSQFWLAAEAEVRRQRR